MDAELKKGGLKACQADASIYCKHRWNAAQSTYDLVLIVSTHVDDLKGGRRRGRGQRISQATLSSLW